MHGWVVGVTARLCERLKTEYAGDKQTDVRWNSNSYILNEEAAHVYSSIVSGIFCYTA